MIDNGNGTRSGHPGRLLANPRCLLAKIPLLLEKADPLLVVNTRSLEKFHISPK
ncbi:hypothetical protein [Metabacillus indicus]|uniref:hypothetical protein n=1 Tax=Metabacillus indicus TaxID=246786 RepID=UPI001300C862|nr:hypothetical protein [Metabacillus indicus]